MDSTDPFTKESKPQRGRSESPPAKRLIDSHIFGNVTLSDNSKAILGNVYIGSSELVEQLEAQQLRQSKWQRPGQISPLML